MTEIDQAIAEVKKSGYGQVVVKVQDHQVVYVEHTIGKQITSRVGQTAKPGDS